MKQLENRPGDEQMEEGGGNELGFGLTQLEKKNGYPPLCNDMGPLSAHVENLLIRKAN